MTSVVMVYRKGELSSDGIDRGWPDQVALPASAYTDANYDVHREFCRDLSLCRRGHSVFHDDKRNIAPLASAA